MGRQSSADQTNKGGGGTGGGTGGGGSHKKVNSKKNNKEEEDSDFEVFTQLQASDISYKVRGEPKMVRQYVLGDILGEGSYAKVKEAIDSHSKRKVAIKILKKRHLKKIPGGENSVKKEISVLKRLHHKNIVELVEYFTIDEKEKMYIVLEYIGGGTLQGLVDRARDNKLPLKQAHFILRQLVDGLDYLHNQNIVHGDIKPDNLMFTEDGVLKMSDFGVAEELGEDGESELLSKSGGSPAFQPPEVAAGASLFSPFKVDVWAAGITLYIMVIGKYPFAGSNVYTLFESISKGEYNIPDSLDQGVSDLIRNILAADPRQRLTVSQIRSHPWLATDIVSDEPFVDLCKTSDSSLESKIYNLDVNEDSESGRIILEEEEELSKTRSDRSGSSVSSSNSGLEVSGGRTLTNNLPQQTRRGGGQLQSARNSIILNSRGPKPRCIVM